MGIVLGAFNNSTWTSLLLWFVSLLLSTLRLMPTLLSCMELMAMEAMPLLPMPTVPTPMPLPADMLPTPPESSTSPRGLLMPSPRLMLMLTTLDMVDTDTVLAMPDMAMALLPMAMATTERGLLMLSLRPMLLFSMELMALVVFMVDTAMLLPMPMVPTPTPMPTDMASKKSSAFSLIV